MKKDNFTDHAFDKIAESQWGLDFDDHLMKAAWEVITSEEWLRADEKSEIESCIIQSKQNLEASRQKLATMRGDLEDEFGAREASRIVEAHYSRLEKFLSDQKQEKPEIAIAAHVAFLLSQATGQPPTYSELDAILTALRDMAKPANRGLPVISPLIKPVIYASEMIARRRHPSDVKTWQKNYLLVLIDCAKRIEKEQLFQKKEIRTAKLRGGTLNGLRKGTDKSSLLFGLIDPKHKPRP